MANLSHWDYVENFTGREAAALVLGLDPITDELAIIAPFLQRMNDAYTATLRAYQGRMWLDSKAKLGEPYFSIGVDDEPFEPKNLHSLRMTADYYDPAIDGEDRTSIGLRDLAEGRFQKWLCDDLRNGFDNQLFERFELNRWLETLGLRTVYRFIRGTDESAETLPPSNRILHRTAERRDLLTPVIEHAQSLCKQDWDTGEVWGRLRSLAATKHPPLIGVDEEGIQYLDAGERLKTLSLKALRMRLARAR